MAQDGHVWEVFCGVTARNRPPAQSILYSRCRRNSAQPWSSMDRLSPAFARTFVPGCWTVPLADRDMFFTCKIFHDDHRVAFADSGRSLVQLVPAGVGNTDMDALDLGFRLFQLLENFFLRFIACCALRRSAAYRRKVFNGGKTVPSERVAKRTTPISMPTASPWAMPCSISRRVWMETNHLPLRLLTVTFLAVPTTSRLFR